MLVSFLSVSVVQLFVCVEVKVPSNPSADDKICRLKKQLGPGCQKGRNKVQEPVKGSVPQGWEKIDAALRIGKLCQPERVVKFRWC